MVHEVNKEIAKFLRDNVSPEDVLTFDDGLYSLYACRRLIEIHCPKNRKIAFISTDAVRDPTVTPRTRLTCEEAMVDWFTSGDRSGYMSWAEIKELKYRGFEIGGHSHQHAYDYGIDPEDIYENFMEDTTTMDKEFKDNLGSVPDTYCLPHNRKQFLQGRVLKGREIFGAERIDIRELMKRPGYIHVQRSYKKQ